MRSLPFAVVVSLSCAFAGIAGCQPKSYDVLSAADGDAGAASCMVDAAPPEAAPSEAGAHGRTWPTYAHDYHRTGRADGYGEMHAPTIAWSTRLGGLLSPTQAWVDDVDGDGRANIVTISATRVTVANPDGKTLWQGPLSGAQSVLGVWNLEGQGAPEIVVDTSSGVRVLAGNDGHVLRELADRGSHAMFVPQAQGGVLVLVLDSSLAAFDFRAGFAAAPLWQLMGVAAEDYVVGDLDGDGAPELVQSRDKSFQALDPLTGKVKLAPVDVGPAAYRYLMQLANVDGQPGEEIIAIDLSNVASPSAGIYVVGARNGSLTTLWSSSVAATVALSTDFFTVDGAVRDLDRDGKMELVYSQWDGTTSQWTTRITDATSGAALGAIPGLLEALGDVDGDGKIEVVVRAGASADRTPVRGELSAYDFDARATGPMAKSWKLAHARVMTPAALRSGEPYDHVPSPIVADFDTAVAGHEPLVGVDDASRGTDTRVALLHGADGSLGASFTVDAGLSASVLWSGDNLTSTSSHADVVSLTDDGVVSTRGHGLAAVASFAAGTYANWIAVAGLSSTRAFIFAATSSRELRWIDGTRLDASGEPHVASRAGGVLPTSGAAAYGYAYDPVTVLEGASPTIVAVTFDDSGEALAGFDGAGVQVWRTPLASGSYVDVPGAYAGDFTGDGRPDLLVQVVNPSALHSLVVLDGVDGHVVTSTPVGSLTYAGDQFFHGSLVDVNADGALDLVAPSGGGVTAVNLRSNPMSVLWARPHDGVNDLGNGTVGAATLTSASLELFKVNGNNGFGPYARLTLAGGAEVYQRQTPNGPLLDTNYVALVARIVGGSVFDMVNAGMADVGLSRVQRISGETLTPVWTVYVSEGAVTPTPPAKRYALHDPVTVDVDHDGVEDVVFGSDDGRLYAVRSTDGSLVFSVDTGAPVAHVIAADVDRDPALEIVASLADGRLVAFDEPGHYSAAPGEVTPAPADAGCGGAASGGVIRSRDDGCAVAPLEPTSGVDASWLCMIAAIIFFQRKR